MLRPAPRPRRSLPVPVLPRGAPPARPRRVRRRRRVTARAVPALAGLAGLAGLAVLGTLVGAVAAAGRASRGRGGFDRRAETGAVPAAFDQDAASYDRLVGANPGYREHLRRSARRLAVPDGGAGCRLLDVGCGTGLSTAALLEAHPGARIVAVDASAQMLARARGKPWPDAVRFLHGRAEHLERVLAADGGDLRFDGVLAAYLLRNLADLDAGLAVLRARLAPGAPLVLHEYSVADSLRARAVWTAVCWSVIIPLGWWATGDAALYRYLWRSVLNFDGVDRLQRRLREAGLVDVTVAPMDGWSRGIVHSVRARAPAEPVPASAKCRR